MIVDELIETWAEYDPVSGYAEGLGSCEGKLLVPTPEAVAALQGRFASARARLREIEDEDLRGVAGKLLTCMSTDLKYPGPAEQVNDCAEAIWYVLLKGQEKADFVPSLLEIAVRLVEFEAGRLRGESFTLEICKTCLDAASFLQATLSALKTQNPGVSAQANQLNAQLGKYTALFPAEELNTDNFDQLFALFEKQPRGRRKTDGYEAMLTDLYDYDRTAEEIERSSLALLREELPLVRALATQVAGQLGLPANSTVGEVYKAMGKRYAVGGPARAGGVGGGAVGAGQQMVGVTSVYTNDYIQGLDARCLAVKPQAAPTFLEGLITSGATNLLDCLTSQPLAQLFLTPGRDNSRLTMLNVLVHEATHAYQGLTVSASSVSPLLKLETYLEYALNEGMAFHREMEFCVAARRLLGAGTLTRAGQSYLDLFGATAAERAQGVTAFELETHIWRVIRYLRAIFDVRVNLGEQSYAEFLKWASGETGLTMQLINNECFTFLASPGYAPSYTLGGTGYAQLQAEKMKQGVSEKDFNTQAGGMGFYPWTIAQAKMKEFTAKG